MTHMTNKRITYDKKNVFQLNVKEIFIISLSNSFKCFFVYFLNFNNKAYIKLIGIFWICYEKKYIMKNIYEK